MHNIRGLQESARRGMAVEEHCRVPGFLAEKKRMMLFLLLLAVLLFLPGPVCYAKKKKYTFGLRVHSIWMNPGKHRTLHVYDSKNNKVTKKISWESSHKKVADVSKYGRITAKKTGTAVIKATMPDGQSISLTVSVIPVKIIGHRGIKTLAPQNTRAAMELAGEAGCWGVETDIRETGRDSRGKTGFILSHDDSLLSMTDMDAMASDLSLEELSKVKVTKGTNAKKYNETLCTLDEFLDVCIQWNMVPFIDIKNNYSEDGIRLMIDTLYEKNLLRKVRFVSSRISCFAGLMRYSKAAYGIVPKIQMNVKSGNYGGYSTVMEQLEMGKRNGYFGYSLYYEDMSDEVNSYVQKKKKTLTLWTINSKDKKTLLRLIKKYKIQSVMVNGIF